MPVARLRAIPPIPARTDQGVRRVLEAIAEQLETLRGLRGVTDSAITDLSAALRALQERVYTLEQFSAAQALSLTISGFINAVTNTDAAGFSGGIDRYGSIAAVAAGDVSLITGVVPVTGTVSAIEAATVSDLDGTVT